LCKFNYANYKKNGIHNLILNFVFWGERLAGHTALLGWQKTRVATERNGTKALERNGTADKAEKNYQLQMTNDK